MGSGPFRAPIAVLVDIVGFTTKSGRDQRTSVKCLWAAIHDHELAQDSDMAVRLIGAGDGAYIVFPCTNAAPTLGRVLDLCDRLCVVAETSQPPFEVRVAAHEGMFELIEVGKDRIEAIGPLLNECARLCGVGDGGQIVVSEALVAGWAKDEGTQIYNALRPSDPDHPWEVFVKHGEPMRVRMWLRPRHRDLGRVPAPKKVAFRDAVEQHIDRILAEIDAALTEGVASLLPDQQPRGQVQALDARVSLWGELVESGVRKLGVTEYRRLANGQRSQRHRRHIDVASDDLGPTGHAFVRNELVVILGLPDHDVVGVQQYHRALANRCRVSEPTVSRWSRHARAFVCIPFGVIDDRPQGVICIDLAQPLESISPEQARFIAQSLQRRYSVALAALWTLRTSS